MKPTSTTLQVSFSTNADKSYKKLPLRTKKKVDKQIRLLFANPSHPSLRLKKVQGENKFEARIDYHYRFTFIFVNDVLHILTLGPHDEGLGKK